MPEIKKQLPLVTGSNKAFWDAAKNHELAAYKCLDCGAYYSQATVCAACHSQRREVFTFCIYQQAFHPAWKDDIPYNVAYVKLAEGPLLMTNIIGCDNKDVYIGMPVEVVFEDVTAEVTLPKFKPVK
ncbi:MAG: Zn-ribbon domain-containing OB-fold protein [Dehalococcoidales bacterium]